VRATYSHFDWPDDAAFGEGRAFLRCVKVLARLAGPALKMQQEGWIDACLRVSDPRQEGVFVEFYRPTLPGVNSWVLVC
jgi:hypothetical protein